MMESPPLKLPDHRDLSPHLLRLLEEHFVTREALCKAHRLESLLTNELADSETNLDNHQHNLTKLVVSWISHSVNGQKNLQHLNIKLRSLISYPSRYRIYSTMIGKILGEFYVLVKEVCRVETIRNYAETTLRLEGLVGDLEDAVFRSMNQHSRTTFSTHLLNPRNSSDSRENQENLLQAVNTMNTIEEILFFVTKTQPQWNSLTKRVDNRLDEILAILRPQIFTDYRALIASIGWPPNLFTSKTEGNQITEIPNNPLLYMPLEKGEKFSKSFLALCALQHLQSRRETRKLNLSKQEEYNTELWAIDELVSSIALQTEYHFTKWAIDQPEFIFALVFRITRDFITGVDDILQPLIDKARLSTYSAKGAWVYAMVQMIVGFLEKQVFSDLAEKYKEKHLKSEISSSWLYLIDLIISYDKKMQSLLDSEPGIFEGFSRNASALSVLCRRHDWLKIWATIELRDARKKLKAELNDEKLWLITEFRTDNENIKHPLIAESAVKLAWEMIDRCRNLPSISMQIQFIKLTANQLLWHFFKVLLLRCKKPESPYTHLKNDDALMRICGSINAARYIESKLREWNDDVSFLEMGISEIRSRTVQEDTLSFFSEEINTLAELETNWLMEIISDIISQFEFFSRDYFYFRNVDYSNNNMELALSYNIIEALDFLRTQMEKMKKFLNPIDFIDFWRSVANGIDHFIFSNILKNDIQFFDDVVEQFRTDMRGLFFVFQPFCARPEAFFPCLRDSLNLFKLKKKEVSHFLVGKKKELLCCNVLHLSSHQVKDILRMRRF